MKKKKKIMLFIPAVILIVLLIGVGFLYVRSKEETASLFAHSQETEVKPTSAKRKDNPKIQKTKITEAVHTETEVTEIASTETVADESEMFTDALFIGDSRTEGFVLLSGIQANYYAYKGLNVATVYTEPVIQKDGVTMTVMEAVSGTEFNRIYLMFGVNETGWMNSDIFIDNYRKIIADIRTTHPDATIYIQSILPVSQSVSDTHRYVKNDTIKMYNELLLDMAQQEGVDYINVAEAVSDSGVLPDEASVDGIHLNQEYCRKWLDYLIEYRKKEI